MTTIETDQSEIESTSAIVPFSVADNVPEPEETAEPEKPDLLPAKRGQCRVCGGPAKDGRSFYCNEHLDLAPNTSTRIASTALGAPRAARDAAKTARKALVRQYKKGILAANPTIVQASQFITGAPDEWMDGVVADVQVGINADGSPKIVHLWEPALRTQFELSEKHAEAIAEAAAQFSESNSGKNMLAMGAVLAPYVTLAAAAGMTVVHLIKLSNIKQQIIQIKAARDGQNAPPEVEQGEPQSAPVPLYDQHEQAS